MKTVYDKKEKCCGCSACVQICPQKCIRLSEDPYGYLYPLVDSRRCLDCGLCRTVCPLANEIKLAVPLCAYAFCADGEQRRLESASGGAFEAVCSAFLSKGEDCCIVGCELDNAFKAKHSCIDNLANIRIFKKSKYVQSIITDQFSTVKSSLEHGKKVVFSGTPCQVAGLKKYLNKEYDNLLTIDFVCHGVPCQKIFDSYLQYLERRYGSKVSGYTFRNKSCVGGKWSNLGVKVSFQKRKEVEMQANEDLYMMGFLSGLFNRDSCYACRFAGITRASDRTIGDYWGIKSVQPELDECVTNGTSLILVNSEKGRAAVSLLTSGLLFETPIESTKKENGQLNHPQSRHPNRDTFLEVFRMSGSFQKSMKAVMPDYFRMKRRETLYQKRWYQLLSKVKRRIVG